MYAITRLGKKVHTQQELHAIQAHNSRLMPVSHLAGPALAMQLIGTGNLDEDVGKLLPSKMRKNAVIAVEMLYTASPEYFRPLRPAAAGSWESDRLDAWRESTMAYLHQRWGERLASATLHLDESTPHIHAIIVPLDSRGKLNCRDIFNRAALIENQSAYAAALQHLGLIRGLEGSKAKHEDIKQYYHRVSTLHSGGTPPDAQRQYGTVAEPKDDTEARHERAEAQRKREQAKAAQFDAMRRRVEANTRLISKLRDEAALVRDLPIEPILEKLGAERCANDKNNWESSVGRISVKGMKFFNHDRETGGGGAIDLVMHIGELGYKDALAWLGKEFGIAPMIGAAMARAKSEAVLAAEKPIVLLRPPAKSDAHWPAARNYLIRERRIDAATVDSTYQAGLLYADRNQNLVFLNSAKSGCELRGTRSSAFHGQRGKKSPFILPALSSKEAALINSRIDVLNQSGKTAAMVECGIDALSLRALGFTGMILAFGGQAKRLIVETARRLHEKGWEVISAFDNDSAGDRMAADVDLALLGLAQPKRVKPTAKDWNDDLKNFHAANDSFSSTIPQSKPKSGPRENDSLL